MERFRQLFAGGAQAHGTWDQEAGARTIHAPASEQDYANHLQGKLGLGIVPVDEQGYCRFAAIDIDDDAIDHRALYAQVAARRFPLSVCRSKSGGAHLYCFVEQPVKASVMIAALKKWAGALGHGRAEIFPKQARVSKSNLGNWINLPYFNSERTVRYAVGASGALTFDEFLKSVQYWDGETLGETGASTQTQPTNAQMPPCLVVLGQHKVDQGGRNNVLFNVAVFYRKSTPNGWEERVREYNRTAMQPPLDDREIKSVLYSVARRKYQYTCNIEPLCSHCDRATCLSLPYGVGHEPWKDAETYAQLLVTHCRKLLTDPPRYVLEVNGRDVDLSSEEFFYYPRFRHRIKELLDLVLPPMKDERWDAVVAELLEKKEEIEAPPDASLAGILLIMVNEFLAGFEVSDSREDLAMGRPVIYNDQVAFRFMDLQKWLHSKRMNHIAPQVIYQILHQQGCSAARVRVKGKVQAVWMIPQDKLNLQTEDFTPPVEKDKKEEL